MQCFLFFASVCPCPWFHVPCLSSIWLAGIQRGKAANNLIAQSHLKLLLKELVDTDVVVVDTDTDTDMDMTTNLQTQRQVNQVVAVALLIGSLSGHGAGRQPKRNVVLSVFLFCHRSKRLSLPG